MQEDFETRFKEKWERRKQRRSQGVENRYGHIWTGVFILLIGVVALIKASVSNVPDWVFSWQMLLIALGFFIGLKHGFRGAAWFILILVGGVFLVRDIYPDLAIRRYIWPLALIAVGAFLIFRPRGRFDCEPGKSPKKDTGSGIEEATVVDESSNTSEDFVDSTSIFGGAKKNIISKNFKGGDLVNIFGGTELDLTRADMKGTATVELTTIFGGTKFVVPSDWTIKSEAVTIFGGLEDKRNMQNLSGNPDKVLLLKGTVIFGGIELQSF
jgi:predicted membrane protein